MDPISNVDRIAALLQQKLHERSRSMETAKSGKAGGRPGQPLAGLDGARAIAAVDDIDDRQRRRAFIQHILTEQFDPALVNDAQFQQLVTCVAQAIEDDAGSAAALSHLLAELGNQ